MLGKKSRKGAIDEVLGRQQHKTTLCYSIRYELVSKGLQIIPIKEVAKLIGTSHHCTLQATHRQDLGSSFQ